MMNVSFDTSKRDKTFEERRLDFGDSGKVFASRISTLTDTRNDYGEDRFITMGHLGGRCVVLVWTPRHGTRRIILMRYAHNDKEANWPGSMD